MLVPLLLLLGLTVPCTPCGSVLKYSDWSDPFIITINPESNYTSYQTECKWAGTCNNIDECPKDHNEHFGNWRTLEEISANAEILEAAEYFRGGCLISTRALCCSYKYTRE